MRRTLTERRPRVWRSAVMLGVVLSSLSMRAHAEPGDTPERVMARQHFDRGVALAKERAYADALREFERAYDVSPHFSVLYNIARAKLALERPAEAIDTLQRYLDDGREHIDARRRDEVTSLLARLRSERDAAETQRDPTAHSSPVPPTTEITAPPANAAAPDRSVPSPVTAKAELEAQRKEQPPSAPPNLRPSASSTGGERTLAYVVGSAGLALSGVALGHFLWNRARYEDWQGQYRAYHADPTDRRRDQANRLADSISRASVASVALAVGAGLAVSTGALLLFISPPVVSNEGAKAESSIYVRGRFE